MYRKKMCFFSVLVCSGIIGWLFVQTTLAKCGPYDEQNKGKIDNGVSFRLEQNTRFKVVVDGDVNSGSTRANDYVLLTVVQNVYGVTNDAEKKRVIVIPQGTKVFGLIDFSQPQYPFYIKGKAKLFVYVSSVILESGVCIPISFAEPWIDPAVKQPKPLIIPCKRDTKQQCIVGRRTKLKVPTSVIASGTDTGLLVAKDDDVTKVVIGLSLLNSLAKATGVSEIVNGPNAELKSKLIFEVKTEEEKIGELYPEKKQDNNKPEKP